METYGTTSAQLASVAVKNHFHASMNPNAQFKNLLTVEKVLKSSMIADPLHLLDCSPISDGASAIILSSEKQSGSGTKQIRMVASSVSTDSLGIARAQKQKQYYPKAL
jgi:acetyl-CoA C-acetyltransferase